MKRLVATFEDNTERADAEAALRDAGFKPNAPDVKNPFFDPVTKMPEERGLLWGGVLGGLLGAALLFSLNQHVFWIPRISPIMTAGRYELVFLGLGLGVAIGGFIGGSIGSVRQVPERDRPRVAVTVPDDRADEAENLLRTRGATAVDGVVTHHEHPQRAKAEGET